jgi:response regulator NasT
MSKLLKSPFELDRRLATLEEENEALREQVEQLTAENETLRRRLNDRAMVEKAKGLLMHNNGWSEDRAYRWLRDRSQREGVRMGDLARSIIVGSKAFQEARKK